MKRIILILITISTFACRKEVQVSESLNGTWKVNTIQYNTDSLYKNFDKETHTINFPEKNKLAYTASMKGIYKIDFIDTLKKDISDTFTFELKAKELNISATQTATVRNLIRKRWILESYKDNDLFLNRSTIDTLEGQIKATRNNK